MSITDVLAIVGALSGLSSIAWNVYQWQQSKAKMKISAAVVTKYQGDITTPNVLMIEMVNAGKRPIQIEMFFGRSETGDFVITPDNLPITLEESKKHVEAYDGTIEQMVRDGIYLLGLYAVDSLGKRWQVSGGDIAKINLHLQQLRSEGIIEDGEEVVW
ncbi:hypothetical protein [Pectinatus brassicae]|uniref:Uncharacterized protein n=1 Tax=Pectinatus brassicae TaxID=862415 RepID=A0A840UQH3_9FIRM|nr:hypothetical protein [Pectinatus brassicae]MBB5336422.1 hypothetical protein [Pectinatus brassicae]